MHVFIAGAGGVVGRPLVSQLVARGHRVTATTRSSGRLAELAARRAEGVVVDGLDAAAVGEAVAHAEPDAIVHQMTALAGAADLKHFDRWFAATNELRTTGTEHLLAAAQAVGVPRFVAQSFTGWPNIREGGAVKSEDDPLDPDPPAAQAQTLAAIRFLEHAVLSAPLEGIVLRYGSFYGRGASDAMVELVAKRKFPLVGGGTGVWSWVHIEDAAAATVAALETGVPGVFNVVDDEPAPVSEWLPELARAVAAKPPLHIPVWLGRLAAGEVGVSMMTQIRGSSNDKAKRELDWQPSWPSWRAGFREALVDPARASQVA
jgi:nucleoside-diphosphate-sugar epimerase